MNKYREQYLESLTNAVGEILKKQDITDTDVEILFLYKQELSKYEYTPVLKQLVKFVKDVNKAMTASDKNSTTKEKGDSE